MSNYRKVGFWKEKGFDNAESIYNYQNKSIKEKRKLNWKLFFYIQNSPMLFPNMGLQYCIITGEIIDSNSFRTDGEWVWSVDLIHYYEEHAIDLPIEFVNHIRKRILPLPIGFIVKSYFNQKLLSEIITSIKEEFSKKE